MTRDEYLECFSAIADVSAMAQGKLTEREKLIFYAGLRAAHAEEALTQGDKLRAVAHVNGLLDAVEALGLLE